VVDELATEIPVGDTVTAEATSEVSDMETEAALLSKALLLLLEA
jgi:hypothetical protein